MNILLISQCDKQALTETRRILDQFAERRGDRTWQSPITEDGLNTLRRLLKKTARRNTAVACHWIRGHDHSELIWIVGDAGRFNAQGAVPTNSTELDVLRREDENDWHSAEDIRLLAAMAALFHDFGKASVLFQAKLKSGTRVADPYRHEWVSLRMFQAFVGDDDDRGWLDRLSHLPDKPDATWVKRLQRDPDPNVGTAPLGNLPSLARIVGWLVVSHHRLPTPPDENVNQQTFQRLFEVIDASWCGPRADAKLVEIKNCWAFKRGTPDASAAWRMRASKLASRMLTRSGLFGEDWLTTNPFVAHLARLTLMLADHHYSSGPSKPQLGDADYEVHANTDPNGKLKQRLDEHLIGVEKNAHRIVLSLPKLSVALPRIARHKGFKRRTTDERFRWQDRAFDQSVALQHRSAQHGFFGVNMASTGCGKTLANGRIMYGLADAQRGARFCIALGLRTLTLQTGKAYRERLGLGEDDLAIMVGGDAVRQLFAHHESKRQEATPAVAATTADRGSASAAALLPDNTYVHYEGSLDHSPLGEWLADSHAQRGASMQKLLNAPVLVCTVDHLMPACESTRGGYQIAPMLRLLTSDLVLDEIDDFDLSDLPALTRFVNWAGLLGSRVLLSSATLPPALVQGLFAAYLAGRCIYQRNRGVPGLLLDVCCAWFDEHGAETGNHADEATFAENHAAFVDKRLGLLSKHEIRRRARIVSIAVSSTDPAIVRPALARLMLQHIHSVHAEHNSVDPKSGKRVSFGLVRMANIDPLIDIARAMFAQGAQAECRIHLCVYHSQHPLLVRSSIEARLDRLLNRENLDALFNDAELRTVLSAHPEPDQIFVVLASPVAEVGRDHDYDWAIVEPSSMRSIIQLAGRVRRHRRGACVAQNVLLLDANRRTLEKPNEVAFLRPGFENNRFRLISHRLTTLLRPEEFEHIDSSPRIKQRVELNAQSSLVDLEHARLGALMLDKQGANEKKVRRWWQTLSHYSGFEQWDSRFRSDPQGRERFVLMPDEDGEQISFCRLEKDGSLTNQTAGKLKPIELTTGPRIEAWGVTNYLEELAKLAEALSLELDSCARRFGTVELPEKGNEQGWRYHPLLGFRRYF